MFSRNHFTEGGSQGACEGLCSPALDRRGRVIIEGLKADMLRPEPYEMVFDHSGPYPLLPNTIAWTEIRADHDGQSVRSSQTWIGWVFSRDDFRPDRIAVTDQELQSLRIPQARVRVGGPRAGLFAAALTTIDDVSDGSQDVHSGSLFPAIYNAQLREALEESRFVVWTRQGWAPIGIGERVIDKRAVQSGVFVHSARGELCRIEFPGSHVGVADFLGNVSAQDIIKCHTELLKGAAWAEENPGRSIAKLEEGALVIHRSRDSDVEGSSGLCIVHDWGWRALPRTERTCAALGLDPGSLALKINELEYLGTIADMERLAHQRGCTGYTVSSVDSNPNMLRIRLGAQQPFYLSFGGACSATRELGKLEALNRFESELEAAAGKPLKLWRLDGTASDRSWENFSGIAADAEGHLGIVQFYERCLFTDGSMRPVWRGLHLGNQGRPFYSEWITDDPRAVCHGKHFTAHL